MTRSIALLGIISMAVAAAQVPAAGSLESLSAAAQRAEARWLMLAQNMDASVARLLPCDARAMSVIQEAGIASEARLEALAAYENAAIESAGSATAAARQVLATEREALNTVPVERTDTEQERAGVESQILNLTESVKRRAALGGALDQLQQIEALIRQRAGWAADQAAASDDLLMLLGNLVIAFENREVGLRQQATAFEAERARWNAYYSDRIARARLECTITGGGR